MSQTQAVLEYIKRYGSISSLEAFRDLACMRLSGRVYDLRKLGFNIVAETETSTNRMGNPVSYSRYRLVEEKGQQEFSL